jgi:diguanylate cyclase (GGDEF)-like protein/PAS domain S-box-containing protein
MTDAVTMNEDGSGRVFQDLFDHAPCGYLVTSPEGTLERVNKTFTYWTGRSADELIGRPFSTLLAPGDVLYYETRYTALLHLHGEVREVGFTMRRSDGADLPTLVHAVVQQDEHGEPRAVRVVVLDATGRESQARDLLAARRDAEAAMTRLRVLEQASSSFATTTRPDELGEVLVRSAKSAFIAASATLLLPSDDGRLRAVGEIGEDLATLLADGLESVAHNASSGLLEVADLEQAARISPDLYKALRRAHFEAFSMVPVRDDPRPPGVLVSLFERPRRLDHDARIAQTALAQQAGQVLARLRFQQELERRALFDQLTGLANRGVFQDRLDRVLHSSQSLSVAVVFIDLDGFKTVNDELGHRVGDRVLTEVGARLRSAVRDRDLVSRYGGDEFVVLLEDTDEHDALAIAERLRGVIAAPFELVPERYSISASVGVAMTHSPEPLSAGLAAVIRMADDAMYTAKRAGGDRVSVSRV